MTEEEKVAEEAKKKADKKAAAEKKKADKAKKVDDGCIVANGGTYVAEVTCTYKMGMYKKGKKMRVAKGERIPHHFIPLKEYKEKLEEAKETEDEE